MGLRASRSGGKGLWVVMLSSIASTYGSNSARGRDGADGAGALAEGVPEHINWGSLWS